MKVRVKEGCTGWIYNQLRHEGETFELVEVEGINGKRSPEQQFSDKWMQKLPGRRRKAK